MWLFLVGLLFCTSASANMQLSIPATVVQSGTMLTDMSAIIRLYSGVTYPATSVSGPSGSPLKYHFYFSYDGVIPSGTLIQNATFTICGGAQTRTLPASSRTYYDGPQLPVNITGLVAFPSCSQPTPPVISNISYTPIQPTSTEAVAVSASVTDDGQIISSTLYYSVNGGANSSIVMSLTSPPVYVGSIPPQQAGDAISFFIVAVDNQSLTSTSSITTYSVSYPTLSLYSPMDGSTISSYDINLTWEDIDAIRYELTIDDDSTFASPEISQANPNFANIVNSSITLNANWIPNDTWYWKVKAIMSDNAEIESQMFAFNYNAPITEQPIWHPWYRLFNETRRDHFYCSSETHSDAAQILGYREEGVEGHLVSLPLDHPSIEPIYRFWWGNSDVGGHFYITGETQREAAIQTGMTYEGITGYGFNAPLPGLIPLYCLKKVYIDGSGRIDNFYTINEFERQNAISAHGFTDLGILAYISLTGDTGPMAWSPWSLIAGKGVSTDNGNFKHHQTTDLDLPGAGPPLRFSHQYNSLAAYYPDALRSLGLGWSHEYSSCVMESAGQLFVLWADGSVHVYDAGTAECLVDGVFDEMTIESSSRIVIKNKAQVRFTFERPAAGFPYLLMEIRDRNSNALTCHYETAGLHRLLYVTDANNRSLSLTYDTADGMESLIQSVTDPMGRQISFTYNPETRDLISYTDPEGHTSTYGYDVSNAHKHQLKTITLPDGTVIDNTYDERRIRTQHWSNHSGGMSLDYSGNTTTVASIDASRSYAITYMPGTGDLQPRRPVEFVQGTEGQTTTFAYSDPQHPTLPSSMQDQRGNYHYFYYDANGNMIEESHPLGVDFQYSYDAFNNVLSVEDPLSHTTSYGYDGTGNLTSITQPGGHVTSLARDNRGLVTSISNYTGTTNFAYNGQGNLITVTDALLHQTHFTVDLAGRVTAVTNANGATTQYAVDDRGLVTQVVDAMGGVMNVGYDANGQITSTNGPGASHTAWEYTEGFLTSYQTPGCPTTYSYRPDGSLATRTRPLGTTSYSYDSAGRLSGIQGASNATFTRDAAGNITAVIDNACNLAFSYDAMNRVTSTTDCWGNTISYVYDANGNTTQIVYGPGKTVQYTYDVDDRMQTVTDWNGRVITYSYRPDDLVSGIYYPNGVTTSYSYDGAGRLTNILHQGPTGVIASYTYTMDDVNNITHIDSAESLEATPPQAETITYNYNVNSQLISDGLTSYDYDGNGNLISMIGQRSLTLQFDQNNRLTSRIGNTIANYSYDVFGNRRSETDGISNCRMVYDIRFMNRVLYEYDETTTSSSYYIYGVGLCQHINSDDFPSYYHHNNVGSVVAISDENGNISHAYKYDSYGSILASIETYENRYKFLGRYNVTVDDCGLYNMYYRYYDPRLGMFINQDSQWGASFYNYSNNSPLVNIDPYGDSWFTTWSFVKNLVKGISTGFNKPVSSGLGASTEIVTISAQVGGAVIDELSRDRISIEMAVNEWGETALDASPDYTWAARYVRTHSGASGALGVDRIADIEQKLRERFPNYYK